MSSSTTSRIPQTQNYVKKILGTAEDYRRLYGSELIRTDQAVAEDAASAVAVAPTVPATSVRRVAKKATPSRKSASAAPITRKKKTRKAA